MEYSASIKWNANWITAAVCRCAGVLACLDGYMNIAIEQTEEYVNGQLKNKYGDAFLRGNNGKDVYIFLLIKMYTVTFVTGVNKK